MLSQEQNDLLTRTGPGTPGGELLRRYWQPAALSEELPPDGPPLPIRLLSEDLVLFRDERGRIGLIGLHCLHRGADLSYGRLEHGGLRCIYHGWLYDVEGKCLQQPGEPEGSRYFEKIQNVAYPCREVGGLILTYLGPGAPPETPAYPFLVAPDELRANSKHFDDCNYLQGNEGNIDSIHSSFLHDGDPVNPENNHGYELIEAMETHYGFRAYWVRPDGPETLSVQVRNNFALPNITAIGDGMTANWHVPIDDTHHWKYWLRTCPSAAARDAAVAGRADLTGDYHLVRNRENRYLQDREEMKTLTYSGIGLVNQPQDACVLETAGPIQDREQEHLGFSDQAIIVERQQLFRAIEDVQAGRDPAGVIRDPARNDFGEMWGGHYTVPRSFDWRTASREELKAAAGPSGQGRIRRRSRPE